MLSVFQKHKLVLADGIHVSVPPALRMHKMALVGNELFSIQDVLLINKIIMSCTCASGGPVLWCLSTLSGSTSCRFHWVLCV